MLIAEIKVMAMKTCDLDSFLNNLTIDVNMPGCKSREVEPPFLGKAQRHF